ncbi:hypothetical protein NDU88_003282 [Pleurodeles waltl]|uniref:Uncharacterized protein n=1 Tax=Pleurodeles waltl TaxID=8319 RepID=A0AAV7NK82_PLEWA|nr:hypothetical protein NDU88_003282 [Pleurodeles waltl]
MGRAGHLDPVGQSYCHHCGPLLAAVCTANGIPQLKDRHLDSWVVIGCGGIPRLRRCVGGLLPTVTTAALPYWILMTSPDHQSVPLAQAQPNTDLPPSGNTSTAPTQRAHTSVPSARQSAVCPPLQGTQENPPPQQQQGPGGSGCGHTAQGTEAQEHRGTGRAAVRQGADRPREPTLHEALSSIMGAYHHSQETMATVLNKFQETQRLQEEQYLGFREELRTISSVLGTIVGVLKDIQKTMRDTVALQGAPDTSLDDELPTTSAGASGQDAPPQDHHTSTPPPADGQPPRKRSLRSRNRTEQDGKTPARK